MLRKKGDQSDTEIRNREQSGESNLAQLPDGNKTKDSSPQ